ncbi:MAG: cellulase family glycosylhydrolase [Treponema sp.]|nr:cellulase family glycosylhydrolase [Treponema sp.]
MFICGNRIIDEFGRCLILRGCNLGGSSKLPASPVQAAGQGTLSLNNPEGVSFVGRPFPLEDAEFHFKRLKEWGFTLLRFVLTWEALEHSGPGIYDEEYLAYLRKILLTAEKEGIAVFLDPHQDVWSRWTGGDGAPAWTLEKIGIDLNRLDAAGAVITFQHGKELPECRDYWKKDGRPMFFWPVNYFRYAASTMFTLFFGGNVYAPDFTIENENAQTWLQERYIAAFRHCYRRLKNCRALAGWGTMNEPFPGYIGCRDLSVTENSFLPLGPTPSPWESMLAASGEAVEVSSLSPWLKKPIRTGKAILNPKKKKLYRDGFDCPWKTAGVWTEAGGQKKLLNKDHFALYNGRPVNFTDDFLKPFLTKFIERMKEADRPALFFIEGLAQANAQGNAQAAHPSWSAADGENTVNAFHYYEALTVFTKKFIPWLAFDQESGKIIIGKKKAAACYSSKLGAAAEWTRTRMNNIPCLLGEFGLPFDLNNRKSFKTGNYRSHEEALSRYYDSIDKNLLHSTIWNYTADNTNEAGDHWNAEDFSIVCGGEGRAIKGWLRPYPMATAGDPLEICWDRKKYVFVYRFMADPLIEKPTKIFLPNVWFGENPDVNIITPQARVVLKTEYSFKEQMFYIYNEGYQGEVKIKIKRLVVSG